MAAAIERVDVLRRSVIVGSDNNRKEPVNRSLAQAIAAVLCRIVDYHHAINHLDEFQDSQLDIAEQRVAEAIEQLPEIR